ncbi:MAG: FHA domain-containing protein [Myxococcota bacterium]
MSKIPPEVLREHTRLEIAKSPDGPTVLTLPMTGAHALVGRASSNDIVCESSRVSWYHALLWTEAGVAWVRDLGSTNQTFLNDTPIKTATKIENGAVLSIALAETFWARFGGSAVIDQRLALEDLTTKVILPFPSDHFTIGGREDADLPIPGASPDMAMTLMVYGDEMVLGVDTMSIPIGVEQPFEVAGRLFQVRTIPEAHAPTEFSPFFHYPYRLTVHLSGASPYAVMEDLRNPGRICTISSNNRTLLLYILARQRDEANGVSSWCSVDQVSAGIWGRAWRAQNSNNLNVLVHRLRKQLKEAGFDPWCIEKRRRRLRLRIQDFNTLS